MKPGLERTVLRVHLGATSAAPMLMVAFLLGMVTVTLTQAQTFNVLYTFTGDTDGEWPYAALIQATDGNLYGTTSFGGANYGTGTIYKITPAGTLTPLYSFTGGADGGYVYSGLIQATDGNLYGTTSGAFGTDCEYGCGTVFEITPSGKLTTLHSFSGTDGAYP